MHYFRETILELNLLVSWAWWLISMIPGARRLSCGDCSTFESNRPRTSGWGLCHCSSGDVWPVRSFSFLHHSNALLPMLSPDFLNLRLFLIHISSRQEQMHAFVIFHFQSLHFSPVIVCSSLKLMISICNCPGNQRYSGENNNTD